MSDTEKDTKWLDKSDSIPSICGFAEASKLLNDSRLKTDYFSLFLAAGANQGLAGEAAKRNLLNLNGEEHRRLRSEIASEFRPRAVDRMRPFLLETAEALSQSFPDGQPFDFMQAFTHTYIEHTTAHFLGIPVDDVPALNVPLRMMSDAALDLRNRAADMDKGGEMLVNYALNSLRERRQKPSNDVISKLVELLAADRIDELFAANLVATVLSAGLEPTILQLGLIVEELAKRPATWDRLAKDTGLVPGILEELLRFRPSNPGVVRCLEENVQQHDVVFAKGTQVRISILGANHDPRRYDNPEKFDEGANNKSHMAFGFGPHHCLGAPLVRAQIQEALKVLVRSIRCPEVIKMRRKIGKGLAGPVKLVIKASPYKQV